jgi:ATP-dependent DNA helicase RecQ
VRARCEDCGEGGAGFDSFRGVQEDAIRNVIDGQDTIVIMPTGGGKSMCFVLPALALPGVALVVSPLLALMQDQACATPWMRASN